MRTGRLLKFQRPAGDVHAYLYREGGVFHASIFLLADASGRSSDQPVHILIAATEGLVEAELRAWIGVHFPPAP